jgi:molecular chaperone GrpE
MDKKQEKNIEEAQEEIIATSEQETEEMVLKKDFDDLKDLASQLEDKYKRAFADYKNLERRTQEQKGEWIKSANKDLLLKLLPVLDTLMLASKHIQDKGLQLSIDQFLRILEQEGVTRIKTVGEDYDPYLMEAIGSTDGEEGKVVEEARAGFKIYETVLRSAQVIVGKGN